jgi:hypothetical protein
MSTDIYVALIGLLGVIIGAIPTYFFMRQKNLAEIEKLNAEADKFKAEAEKIRADFQKEILSSAEAKVKILFVAANPIDTPRIMLDQEVRGIKESLLNSDHLTFELEQALGVRWDDLRRQLLKHTPTILHISGYGNKDGILLENESGRSKIIHIEALKNLLSLFSDKIKIVIVNTKFSDEAGKSLAQVIDFVIGTDGRLGDITAAKFAAAFYEALADNKDIYASFEFAKASIDTKGYEEHGTYQFYTYKKKSEKYFL